MKTIEYVVISIVIGIPLLLWLMPPVEQSRQAARRTQCKINLKRIGLAFHAFNEIHGRLPAANGPLPDAEESAPAVSWRVAVLPFLDEQELYQQYDPSVPWDADANIPVMQQSVFALLCPSQQATINDQGFGLTSYVVPTGNGTIFSSPESAPLNLSGIPSGGSQTLMAFESHDLGIVWTDPRDFDVTAWGLKMQQNNVPAADEHAGSVTAVHGDAANVLMADGSVRILSQETDPETLRKMLSPE